MASRHPAALAKAGLVAVLLLSSCLAPGQESETRIDAPILLKFEVFFGSAFGDRDEGTWPEFSIVLSEADAELLGSESNTPFVYRPDDRQALAEARVIATNFVVETEDDGVDVPCLADPILVVATTTGTEVVVQESGFCPEGRYGESIRIEPDLILAALPQS